MKTSEMQRMEWRTVLMQRVAKKHGGTSPPFGSRAALNLVDDLDRMVHMLRRMKAAIECLPWGARRPQLDSMLKMINEALEVENAVPNVKDSNAEPRNSNNRI